MTNVYLIPPTGDTDTVVEMLTKAGVVPSAPETLREFIITTHGQNIAVTFIKPSDFLILLRNANTLVDVLPTVVMAVPGLLYTHEWAGIAATFPAIDWLEFKEKFRKSGSTAFTPDAMGRRHAGLSDPEYGAIEDAIDDTADGEASR